MYRQRKSNLLPIKGRYRTTRASLLGFTLIELLVVISIIALLVAILIPVIRKAKIHAQIAVCMSNMHQWALIWKMYTDDHDGSFNPGYDYALPWPSWCCGSWFHALRNYYDSPKIRVCPTTSVRKLKKPGVVIGYGNRDKYGWWFGEVITPGNPPCRAHMFSSYGENGWTSNPGPYRDPVAGGGPNTHLGSAQFINNWRHTGYKGANNIPVFSECRWPFAHPENNSPPPPWENVTYHSSGMTDFCVNRHNALVTAVFMDWSVRKVGLKELWTLKWHQNYETKGPYTIAYYFGDPRQCADYWDEQAPWMKNMPEY